MPKKVLVVDDSDFVRQTLAEILTQAHYQIIGEAENGDRAVELYFKLNPDVVTMDIVMPKLSGVEATRKILKKDKNAKIIMVSAMGQETLIMEAINAGARDYVVKPFSQEDIVRALEHVLNDESQGREK